MAYQILIKQSQKVRGGQEEVWDVAAVMHPLTTMEVIAYLEVWAEEQKTMLRKDMV